MSRQSEVSVASSSRLIDDIRSETVPASPAMLETSTYASCLRIFILSDVRLYREGLAWTLSQRPDIDVIGAAAPSPAIFVEISQSAATVVLLDVAMPRALSFPREIVRLTPRIKVIAFAVSQADHELMAYAEAGIVGYVPRDSTVDELVMSIRNALRGELVCSPRLAGLLYERVAALSHTRQQPCKQRALTRREREIMDLIQRGQSNKEIARSLRIEPATVKNHVHNILEKLQVSRRGEAVAWHWAQGSNRRINQLAVS